MMRRIVPSLQKILMQNEDEKSFKSTEQQSESIRSIRMCFYCFASLLQHSGIEMKQQS